MGQLHSIIDDRGGRPSDRFCCSVDVHCASNIADLSGCSGHGQSDLSDQRCGNDQADTLESLQVRPESLSR